MPTIPITHILTPLERQRREFPAEALLELAQSIRAQGLLHAIVLRPDGRTLIAGERRLRAIEEHLAPLGQSFTYNGAPVPPGEIPYTVAISDDPLILEEIELAENTARQDLTWQERAQATARLVALRRAQAAQSGATAPSLASIAESVDSSFGTVREAVLIAPHLARPEVAAAKSSKEAFKILKSLEERERHQALAAEVGRTYTSAAHTVIQADCLEWLADAPPEQFDCILTDPPYGMSAEAFGDAAGKLTGTEHHYDDSRQSFEALITAWAPLSYRIAKPQAHAYVWCDIDGFPFLREAMRAAGWYVFRTPFINYKSGSGRIPLPGLGPKRQWEMCLYAIKGKREVLHTRSDVIVSEGDPNLGHGAQKPVELYRNLLERTCRPGDAVLDCFAGTGTILPAAHALRLRATAIERDSGSYGICLERMRALDEQRELPL